MQGILVKRRPAELNETAEMKPQGVISEGPLR
jgi:hypothetical protein